jgi:hypothetical protein
MGTMLVMRDALDGVFHAWIGERLHLTRESHFGGGD